MPFASLRRCIDLREEHLARASESSDAMGALLARFAAIAKPGEAAPLVFAVLGRMGSSTCPWLDGELRAEVTALGADATQILVATTLGGGFRQKLFPDLHLAVPFDELATALRASPHLADPLAVRATASRIVLTSSLATRVTSLPPPMVKLDPSCWFRVPGMTLPGLGTLVPTKDGGVTVSTGAAPSGDEEPKVVLKKRVRTTPRGGSG